MIEDRVIPLPGGGTWIVRAFQYQTADEARVVWEKIEEESRGKRENFSIWRTTNPERTEHFVVVCGRPGNLPEVEGGKPYRLDRRIADDFALRRARTGMDAFAKNPDEHFEMRARYGEDHPMKIDPETGGVEPYKPS